MPPKLTYTTATNPYSIVAADFNADGKVDIAAVNNSSSSISIFMNTGTGTFAAKVDYNTGANPYSATAADFNGDGKLDLAVVIDSSTVSVLMNTGTGTFATKVDYATGTTPYSVTATDLEGDGDQDMIVANRGSNTLSVFMNNGTGTFAAKVDYNTASGPWFVTTADLNSDTRPDLIVANQSVGSISVFMNTIPSVSKLLVTTSAASVAQVIQGASSQIADLLQVKSSSATMLAIGATGSFVAKNGTNSTTAFQIQNASGTTFFNTDTTNGSVTIGSTATASIATVQYSTAAKVDYTAGYHPQGVAAADFNGDSKLDLVTANTGDYTVSILMNNSTGTFATKVDYATGNAPYSVATADVNGDGKLDVTVANQGSNNVSVLINNGNGTFATKVDYAAGSAPYYITALDVNSDSKPDLVSANNSSNSTSVLINNGNGTFATKVDYNTSNYPYAGALADFNGDGKIDIATSCYNNVVSVFMNNGNGTFAAKVDYGTGSQPYSLATADLNGDNKSDLIAANYTSNTISVLINNGTGTFVTKIDYTTGSAPNAIITADLNNDNKPDIAVSNLNSASVSVFINTTPTIPTLSPKLTVNTAATSVAQVIQGASGQTADLLQAKDISGNTMFSIGATGSVLVKNNTNSTTAFQVQNAAASSIFDVDSTNGRVGIGTNTPANQLSINNLSTADSLAQVAISTKATTNKGLVIQGMNSQTADLFQTQNSSGTVLVGISAAGALSVVSATVSGNLTVNGHIITGGIAPTIAAGAAACTTPTVSISGNDNAGTITVITGTSCGATTGTMATVTFNSAFGSAPKVMLTPVNIESASLAGYNGAVSTASFTLDTTIAPTDATTYKFNYLTVQ